MPPGTRECWPSAGNLIDRFLEFHDRLLIRDRRDTKFLIYRVLDRSVKSLVFHEVTVDERAYTEEAAQTVYLLPEKSKVA